MDSPIVVTWDRWSLYRGGLYTRFPYIYKHTIYIYQWVERAHLVCQVCFERLFSPTLTVDIESDTCFLIIPSPTPNILTVRLSISQETRR